MALGGIGLLYTVPILRELQAKPSETVDFWPKITRTYEIDLQKSSNPIPVRIQLDSGW